MKTHPQEFSGIEKEVWETVVALNRCWTEDDPQKLESYFHERMVAITPSDPQRREGREACIAGWAGFARSTKILSWKTVNPHIQVFGDSAVVTYYYELLTGKEDQPVTYRGREMYLMHRQDNRWWAVADQFSPFPGSAS